MSIIEKGTYDHSIEVRPDVEYTNMCYTTGQIVKKFAIYYCPLTFIPKIH
jgi:hypothetical protein